MIEVRDDLHSEIRKLALLNDPKIYELANAILADFQRKQEETSALIKTAHRMLLCEQAPHRKKKGLKVCLSAHLADGSFCIMPQRFPSGSLK